MNYIITCTYYLKQNNLIILVNLHTCSKTMLLNSPVSRPTNKCYTKQQLNLSMLEAPYPAKEYHRRNQ